MKSLFKRRSPVDEKNRQLAAEIARLEAEIASLEKAPKSGAPSPRVRSTAYGAVSRSAGAESAAARRNAASAPAGVAAGAGAGSGAGTPTRNRAAGPSSRRRLMGADASASAARASGKRSEAGAGAAEVPVNDLGLRKYDLVSAWKRVAEHFRGPAPGSSRMVHYLAVGSVQGLRPLRYERRVARNRTLGLTALLLAVLWGLAHVYFKNRGL